MNDDERIHAIAKMMRSGTFRLNETDEELATQWGCSLDAVHNLAEMAAAGVRKLYRSPVASVTVETSIYNALAIANTSGDTQAIIRCAEAYSRVIQGDATQPMRSDDTLLPDDPQDRVKVLEMLTERARKEIRR